MPTHLPLPTLRRYLRQHVVTVFSVSYCPYCDAIKALIGGARTTHVVPDLDTSATVALTFRPSTRSTKTTKTLTCTGDTIRTALKRLLPHHQTVPCVFVRDTFVGGYDDVKALVDNGTWAAKVAAAVKRRRGTRATRQRGTRRQRRVTRRQKRVRKRHVVGGGGLMLRDVPPRTHVKNDNGSTRYLNTIPVHKRVRQADLGVKPSGFWYGLRHYWLTYHPMKVFRDERDFYDYRKHPTRKLSHSLVKRLYKVVLPPRMRTTLSTPPSRTTRSQVLVIRSYKELVTFSKRYGTVEQVIHWTGLRTTPFGVIHWTNVAHNYAGIEVSTLAAHTFDKRMLQKRADVSTMWFSSFDVPSGCVWHGAVLDAIRSKLVPVVVGALAKDRI